MCFAIKNYYRMLKLMDFNFSAALFDLDGVLIDSETEYTKIWSEIGRRFHNPLPDFAHRIKGMTLENILNTHFPDTSTHTQIKDVLHQMEFNMVYNWKPGAQELLEFLRDNNIPRVLVTSSDNLKMKHLEEERPDLLPLMSDVVTADRISRSKPDPEGYLLGASLAGVEASRCLVFEDSLQGVKAGKASGAFVVGVAGTIPEIELHKFSDIVVNQLTEILEIIRQ